MTVAYTNHYELSYNKYHEVLEKNCFYIRYDEVRRETGTKISSPTRLRENLLI